MDQAGTKTERETGYIAEIESPHGITTDQVDINDQFKKFYEDLYSLEAVDGPEIDGFLMNLANC